MLDIIITATKHTTILRRRPWEEAVTLSSSAIASRIIDLCYGRRWMNSRQCRCASVGRTLHTEWSIVDDAICLCIFVWGVCVCAHMLEYSTPCTFAILPMATHHRTYAESMLYTANTTDTNRHKLNTVTEKHPQNSSTIPRRIRHPTQRYKLITTAHTTRVLYMTFNQLTDTHTHVINAIGALPFLMAAVELK